MYHLQLTPTRLQNFSELRHHIVIGVLSSYTPSVICEGRLACRKSNGKILTTHSTGTRFNTVLGKEQQHLVRMIAQGELRTFDDWVCKVLMRQVDRVNRTDLWNDDGSIKEKYSDVRILAVDALHLYTLLETTDGTPWLDGRVFETYLQTVQYLFNHDLICLFKNVNAVQYNWVDRQGEGDSLQKQIVEWSEYTISGNILKDNQLSVTPALYFFIKNGFRTDSQKQIQEARTFMLITVIITLVTFIGTIVYDRFLNSEPKQVKIVEIPDSVLSRLQLNPTTIVDVYLDSSLVSTTSGDLLIEKKGSDTTEALR